ncbi:TonB family protein [Paucibacter sp. O1-1]|nr:TonB family protein [Paucibacter sp. O1-1]MDA3826725.1 TonB family protein [Paucibacter sp. O1-1]
MTALLLSLLIHALLLSLSFGGDGPGLPGLVFPWQERRAEVPDLRVVLTQAPQAAAPVAAPAEAAEPAPEPAAAPEPASPELPAPAPQQTVAEVASLSLMAPEAMMSAEPPVADPSPDEPAAAAEPIPPTLLAPPDVIRALRPDHTSWALPAVPATLPLLPAIAVAPSASSPQTRELRAATTMAAPVPVDAMAATRAPELAVLDRVGGRAAQELEARLEAARQEAARQEAARQEAARQDALRAEALRQEAIRQAAARQESARLEAERLETQKREAQAMARRAEAEQQAAARQEAARQEAARQEEVLRQESARVEAQRQAAARQAAAVNEAEQAARDEMARQDAARAEAARLAAAQAKAQAEAQREERLRAIGRQLDEEAARRDAIAARLPPSASSIRRGRLFGRSDANAELVLYAEAWSRKIELNQTFELVGEAARQPHAEPLVTVAVRSDGSVESVSFVRSSGVPAIDAAVRRIVESQANYPAFPPALAREFDVIEIRRTWRFDMAVRLY